MYCEPFFGSGAVFFTKTPSGTETINDLDGEIVNLFVTCREYPEELAKQLEMTPYSREEYMLSCEKIDYVDEVERARRFLVRVWQAFGGKTYSNTSWAHDRTNKVFRPKYWSMLPDRILQVVERLRMAQIECMDARELIPMYNSENTLLYVDPPYLRRVRSNRHYRHEFCTVSEHQELLSLCKQHKGSCILSGYDDQLYDDVLGACGWEKRSVDVQTNVGHTAKEILWLNERATFEQRLF